MGKRGEAQVKFSWVQSHRQQEQRSYSILLFTADSPDYISMSCFLCKETLPLLGWVGAYQPRGPLTEPCSCQGLSPLPQFPYLQGSLDELCSPPLCQGLAFSAQRSLTQPCTCQSFFSVYLVTVLPQKRRY
jgi:hypothetical protein